MELNLESARAAREVEARIKTELGRLSPSEQKSVLERVAVDVLAELSTARMPPPPPTSKSPASAATADNKGTPDKRMWETILAYCLSHPAPKYRTVDLAEAIMPEKIKENRNVANSMIFTAVKRRSVGESGDPFFVTLGKGKVRLATEEERAKAKEKNV